MDPRTVVFGLPTIPATDTAGEKLDKFLLYLWKFVPGIADEYDIIVPDDDVKLKFYEAFHYLCDDEMINLAFEDAEATYGYPWKMQHDSPGGVHWAIIFARAAFAILFGIDQENIGQTIDDDELWVIVGNNIHDKVFGGMDKEHLTNYLEWLFKEARKQNEIAESSRAGKAWQGGA